MDLQNYIYIMLHNLLTTYLVWYLLFKGHDDLCWILHGDVGLQSAEPDQGDDGVAQCWEQAAGQGLLPLQPHVDQWQVMCDVLWGQETIAKTPANYS